MLNELNVVSAASTTKSPGFMPSDNILMYETYLHVEADTQVIQVVGIAKEGMAGSNVLWLLWGGNVAKYKSFEQNSV